MDKLPPKHLTDAEIEDHHQTLYASLDGLPASNHKWLAELLAGLEWERARTNKLEAQICNVLANGIREPYNVVILRLHRLEAALREVRNTINARFESYAGGDRPPSPPTWLIELAAKIDAIVAVETE